jgi:hypothetical protein
VLQNKLYPKTTIFDIPDRGFTLDLPQSTSIVADIFFLNLNVSLSPSSREQWPSFSKVQPPPFCLLDGTPHVRCTITARLIQICGGRSKGRLTFHAPNSVQFGLIPCNHKDALHLVFIRGILSRNPSLLQLHLKTPLGRVPHRPGRSSQTFFHKTSPLRLRKRILSPTTQKLLLKMQP